MIPTNTLRERLELALLNYLTDHGLVISGQVGVMVSAVKGMTDAAIEAIGDPVLIKTADTLEPTFTLRAQDAAAPYALNAWIAILPDKLRSGRAQKIADAITHRDAFEAWPTRKWPD